MPHGPPGVQLAYQAQQQHQHAGEGGALPSAAAAPAAAAAPGGFEPPPPQRVSKKRRLGQVGGGGEGAGEGMVRLGEEVQADSERLLPREGRPVRLSAEDKAAGMELDATQLRVSSSRGYRTVRGCGWVGGV